MERNHDPSTALFVDPMTAKPAFSSIASASAAVRRGILGMNFDGGVKNLLAERRRPLIISQSLEEEFDCLTDVGESLFDGLTLRLASF